MIAHANLKVEIIVSTPESRRRASLEELELTVGHLLRHGGEAALENVRGAYGESRRAAREALS